MTEKTRTPTQPKPPVGVQVERPVRQRLARLLQLEVMSVMRSHDAEWWQINRERQFEMHLLCAALRDAERYRKLCEVPGALDAFTAAYHNTQTKAQLDAAMDGAPDVGAA